MRLTLIAAVVAIAFATQTSSSAQQAAPGLAGPKVQITFEEGGLVTLIANGATVREVLAEWARLGGSSFVNSERLAGTPLTLHFQRQPEKDVMASLLRQAAGFVLGPRRAGTIGASSLEVVYILPTSNPMAGGYGQPVQYQQPQPQFPTAGAPDDELPPVGRGGPPPPNAPPAPAPTPTPDYSRPAGVSPVAVAVVPVVTAGQPTPTPTPTPTPAPPPPGRGGGAGS